MASKQNTLFTKTFLKWSNNNDFDFKVDNNNDLSLQKCKICTVHLAKIRREARKCNIHGPVLDDILNYTEGAQYIHKANFDKHCKVGSLHNLAKKTLKKDKNQTTSHHTMPIALETNQQKVSEI